MATTEVIIRLITTAILIRIIMDTEITIIMEEIMGEEVMTIVCILKQEA